MIQTEQQPFAALARSAIETMDGADAVDTICRAWAEERTALTARQQAAEAALKEMTARVRTSDDIVRTLHTVAAAELLRGARQDAFVQQLSRVVSRVRTVTATAREADEAPETLLSLLADLAGALAEPVDEPEWPPVVVAFVPELQRDRVGRFESADGSVHQSYPLVGWSLVVRKRQAEPRRLEPTFLVDDRSVPVSLLVETYGMQLRQLL